MPCNCSQSLPLSFAEQGHFALLVVLWHAFEQPRFQRFYQCRERLVEFAFGLRALSIAQRLGAIIEDECKLGVLEPRPQQISDRNRRFEALGLDIVSVDQRLVQI